MIGIWFVLVPYKMIAALVLSISYMESRPRRDRGLVTRKRQVRQCTSYRCKYTQKAWEAQRFPTLFHSVGFLPAEGNGMPFPSVEIIIYSPRCCSTIVAGICQSLIGEQTAKNILNSCNSLRQTPSCCLRFANCKVYPAVLLTTPIIYMVSKRFFKGPQTRDAL